MDKHECVSFSIFDTFGWQYTIRKVGHEYGGGGFADHFLSGSPFSGYQKKIICLVENQKKLFHILTILLNRRYNGVHLSFGRESKKKKKVLKIQKALSARCTGGWTRVDPNHAVL